MREFKRGVSPFVLLVLIVIILAFFMILPYNKEKIDLSTILLEKYTDYTKKSVELAIIEDNTQILEDAIRFYTFSLEKLNLSGDNNKLKVLNKVKIASVMGIPKEDYDKIVSQNWMDKMPPPIIFKKSLMDNLIKHLKEIKKYLPGTYNLRICQYYFINDKIYKSIHDINSSLLTKNKVFLCNDNESKITPSEKLFCNVTLENYDPDGDLDHDNISNKNDCDEDGDNISAIYNYFTHKFCGGTDTDDNNDGIYDGLDLYPVKYNITIVNAFNNKIINVTKTFYLPYSARCRDPFAFDIENLKVYYYLNPYYIFIMPFESKPNPNDKFIDVEDEFDYDRNTFYVWIAPIDFYYKVWLDKYNYNEFDLFLQDLFANFDIGIYRQTSICDGNLSLGC